MFLYFDFRFFIVWFSESISSDLKVRRPMLYGFLYVGCSKDAVKPRNTPDQCCVRQISVFTITGHARLSTNTNVLASSIDHLFKISYKHEVFSLNKHNEEPATRLQTVRNETLCSRLDLFRDVLVSVDDQ